jgi:hypothetical protein
MKKRILLSGCMLLSMMYGFTTVIIVPDQKPTIHAGILSAQAGDTVLVREGTYNEFINFDGRNIVVGSLFLTTGDSSYIDQTIISAPSQGSVVTFEGYEMPEAKLVGFTITGGTGKLITFIPHGGGIFCNNSSPTLEHLLVTGNVASGMTGGAGGGMFFANSEAVVSHCRVTDNDANYGGGIRCNSSSVTIGNSWIRDNYAVSSGGGLMLYESQETHLTQCVFTGNAGMYGGAVCLNGSQVVIDRCTFYKNSGFYGGCLDIESYSHAKVINSILWDNSMQQGIVNEIFLNNGYNTFLAAYSDIMGGEAGIHSGGQPVVNWMEENIDLYPGFTDTTNLNLQLESTSPCVDAGTALYIYNGDTLANISGYSGTDPDMGAYENIVPVSVQPDSPYHSAHRMEIIPGDLPVNYIIRLNLEKPERISISLYDLRGNRIYTIADEQVCKGTNLFALDRGNLRTGIYVVNLLSTSGSESLKVLFH